jgi:membrane protease YdiL (CAAX protease family)
MTSSVPTNSTTVFTLRLALTLLAAALAAALIAPLVAPALAWSGFHFPFPRIFDRVVMVTLAIVLWWESQKLGLIRRLRAGFAQPLANVPAALYGAAAGAAAITVLWLLAWFIAPAGTHGNPAALLIAVALNLVPALTIAVIEEGFFRAFLLDGMAEDFGTHAGLVASSVIYAVAHLVRSPARFELSSIHPLAGLQNLAASLAQLGHPLQAAPGLLGLFLLGLLLGKAFIETGRVYFSIGLHAILVIGAKTWRKLAPAAQSAPGWLSGYGRPPLISGAAAWLITMVLLIVIRRLTYRYRLSERDGFSSLST